MPKSVPSIFLTPSKKMDGAVFRFLLISLPNIEKYGSSKNDIANEISIFEAEEN
jgi:hypothetical protein